MEALLNRYRNLSVLLVVILAQLLLLAYQVKTNQDVRLIRVWAVTAITPIAHVLEVVRANTIGIAENYFVLIKVREQNQQLLSQNGQLKLENSFLRTQLQTADRVKALAAFQQQTQSRTLASRIIGNATGTNSKVVFVDRGSTAGVMKGMAVVTPDGIVGKVIAAYPTASQVQLITDENFAAGVISDKHRVHGTIMGKGQNKPIVNYVQNEEQVDQGEIFYTSGDDRVFPKGMPVGTATVVRPGKNFKEIYITPSAFQNGIEEVLIVLEGVHGVIPEHKTEVAGEVKILPPPPADPKADSAPANDLKATLQTEADRLKERYKKIGELENHKFGEGLPGSKPPDFTIDPYKAANPPAAAVLTPPAGNAAATVKPGPAATPPVVKTPSASPQAPVGNPPPAYKGVQPAAAKPATGTGNASAPPLQPSKPPAARPRPVTVPGQMTDDGRPRPAPIP
jgi:rod shape-determining protein MreC